MCFVFFSTDFPYMSKLFDFYLISNYIFSSLCSVNSKWFSTVCCNVYCFPSLIFILKHLSTLFPLLQKWYSCGYQLCCMLLQLFSKFIVVSKTVLLCAQYSLAAIFLHCTIFCTLSWSVCHFHLFSNYFVQFCAAFLKFSVVSISVL